MSVLFLITASLILICNFQLLYCEVLHPPTEIMRALKGLPVHRACLQRLSAYHLFNSSQLQALCGTGRKIDDSAVRCVQDSMTHQLVLQSIRRRDYELDMITARILTRLCAEATSTGSSECWNATPADMLQNLNDLRSSLLSLDWAVEICRNVSDKKPMYCMQTLHNAMGDELKLSGADHVVRSVALADATKLCREFDGDVSIFGACISRAPKVLTKWNRCRLCQNGKAYEGNHECAIILLQQGLDQDLVASLCASSLKDDSYRVVVRCYIVALEKHQWLKPAQLWKLCSHSDPVPALKCAAKLYRAAIERHPFAIPTKMVTEICTSRHNSDSFINCAKNLPLYILDTAQVTLLCLSAEQKGGKHSSYPLECIQTAESAQLLLKNGSANYKQIFDLCQFATSLAPISCMRDVMSDPHLHMQSAIDLCSRAKSERSQICYYKYRGISASQAAQSCAADDTTGLDECMEKLSILTPSSVRSEIGLLLCANATSSYPATCYHDITQRYTFLEKTLICNQASNTGPVNCASIPVTRLDQTQQALLCHKSPSSGSAVCAIEAPHQFSPDDVITLCKLAENNAPAKCASSVEAHVSLPSAIVAEVCHQATSVLPGKCLSHAITLRKVPTALLIQDCRRAKSLSTYLRVVNVSHPCHRLEVNCPLRIAVNVFDQYNLPMASIQNEPLRIILEGDSSAAVMLVPNLHEPTSVITVQLDKGAATIEGIQFITSGRYGLRFEWQPGNQHWKVGHLLRVDVGANREVLRMNCCKHLFDRFQCVDDLSWHYVLVQRGVSMLYLAHTLTSEALNCSEIWAANHSISYWGSVGGKGIYLLEAFDKSK